MGADALCKLRRWHVLSESTLGVDSLHAGREIVLERSLTSLIASIYAIGMIFRSPKECALQLKNLVMKPCSAKLRSNSTGTRKKPIVCPVSTDRIVYRSARRFESSRLKKLQRRATDMSAPSPSFQMFDLQAALPCRLDGLAGLVENSRGSPRSQSKPLATVNTSANSRDRRINIEPRFMKFDKNSMALLLINERDEI